jgi:tetratricopeptide (TPR) repeat protein
VLRREKQSAASTSGEGPLVGRVLELQELRRAYDDARAGRGGVHLVLGDPGVGKTRLAAALAEHAAGDGATVVWTRGWGRAAPAYWPWVEVVRSLCQDVDGATLRRELGDGADELLRLAPELAERLPAAQSPPEHPLRGEEASEIARFTLFDALVALLRSRGAMAPVVVVIDDLQAVDEGSLVALDFVSRMLRDVAALLVVTMHERVPERSPHAQAALSNIVRSCRRLVLGGLTSDDVGRLMKLASGIEPAPALARAVHARTEGNPFFAREILALLLAEGRLEDPPDDLPLPDGVRETIRRRLEPLDELAVDTLGLAAILGRTFHLAALEQASPLDREHVLAALDQAAELGLVVELPATVGQYRFGHGLIGDTLLADMSGARRMAAHGCAGAALEHVYRGAIDSHLPELAHHFLLAAPRGDLYKAVDYAQRAARRALDNLAYEQAADLFARALEALELLEIDVPRRAALLLGLGTAQSRAGRSAARATFDAAIAAARSIGAHDTFARAALGAAPFALTPGFVDDAHVALLVEALERISPGDDPLRVRLLGSLATALYWSDAGPRRAALAREALEMARRLGDDVTLAFALSSAQLATCGPDSTQQSLRWLTTLFALSERAGESELTLDARSRHIDVLLELDDLAGADVAIETLERLTTQARDRRAAAFVPLHRSRRVTIEGRFEEARNLLAEASAMSDALPATTIPMTVDSQLVVLKWVQLGPREIGEEVRGYADGVPAMPVWRAALAAAFAARGRTAEAQLEFDRLSADDYAALPRDNLWLGAMAALTETAAALGLRDRALELHAKLAPFAGRNVVTPTSAFLGPVEMWLGILARVGGRDEQALEHLLRARTSATRNGSRMILARIDVEEAEALLVAGGADAVARAEQLVAQAAVECDDMRLISLLEQIDLLRGRLEAGTSQAAGAPAGMAAEPAAPATAGTPAAPANAGAPVAPGIADAAAAAGTAGTAAVVPTLRRTGDVWTLDDGRSRLHLTDGRGVRLLALLLERPGREIHSLDLVAIVDGTTGGAGARRSGGQEAAGRFGVQGGAGPRLDAKAKGAYRARVAALRTQIAEAETLGDEARASRARAELEFVSRELELAVGIGGRDRESGSHAERARVNVTRAIRATLKRIAGYDARLGRELEGSVRTGTFCVYEPDPRRPLRGAVDHADR